jgi:hypothetical protein
MLSLKVRNAVHTSIHTTTPLKYLVSHYWQRTRYSTYSTLSRLSAWSNPATISPILTPHVTLRADDFEVSIFLTETSTRHSLVNKHKHFHDTTQTKLKSNSGRLISETNDAPIDLDMVAELAPAPFIRREETDEDEDVAVALAAIPAINESAAGNNSTRRPKRARSNTTDADADADSNAGHVVGDKNSGVEIISDEDEGEDEDEDEDGAEDDEDGLFVQSPTRETPRPPPAKRRRAAAAADEDDDKKKLAMDISYEGFSIYGRVLCLVVKRRDGSGADLAGRGGNASSAAAGAAGGGGSNAAKPGGRGRGQTMMENFIISTQIPAGTDVP